MRLRITKITARADERPPGYVQAVLARGVVDGEWLEISDEALAELRAIYRTTTPEPALPSMVTMLKSLTVAAGAEAAARWSGVPALTAEEMARRIGICHAPCEHFRPSDNRCALCGCVTDYKTRLRSQSCPAGKW